ncbi:MAG: hypothetical protein NTAFB01_23690 [Nitrospira sp.]
MAYFLADLVEESNLTPILITSGGMMRGTAPYHPQLPVKVLLYVYAVGIPPHDRLHGNWKRMWRFGSCQRISGRTSGRSMIFGSSIYQC